MPLKVPFESRVDPQETTAFVPQPKVSGADFGANAFEQLGQIVGKVANHEIAKANVANVQESLNNQLTSTQQLYQQFQQFKGKNALANLDDYQQKIKDVYQQGYDRLSNDSQRQAYVQRAESALRSYSGQLHAHAQVEHEAFAKQQYENNNYNLMVEAASNPTNAETITDVQQQLIDNGRTRAKQLGEPFNPLTVTTPLHQNVYEAYASDLNFASGLQYLKQHKKEMDPLVFNRLKEQANRALKAQNVQAQAETLDKVKEHIAALDSGIPPDKIPDLVTDKEIRSVFKKAKADKLVTDLNLAKDFSKTINNIQWDTPKEINEKSKAFKKENLNPDTFIEQSKQGKIFDEAVNAYNKALVSDPKGYLLEHPTIKGIEQEIQQFQKNYKNANPQDKPQIGQQLKQLQKWEDTRLLALQKHLGLLEKTGVKNGKAPYYQLISKAELTQLYSDYQNNGGQALKDFVQGHDNSFRRIIMKQLVNQLKFKDIDLTAAVVPDETVSNRLIQESRQGEEKINEDFKQTLDQGTSNQSDTIKLQASKALAPFFQTIQLSPSHAQTSTRIFNTVVTDSKNLMLQQGLKPDDAVTQSVNDIINNHLEFVPMNHQKGSGASILNQISGIAGFNATQPTDRKGVQIANNVLFSIPTNISSYNQLDSNNIVKGINHVIAKLPFKDLSLEQEGLLNQAQLADNAKQLIQVVPVTNPEGTGIILYTTHGNQLPFKKPQHEGDKGFVGPDGKVYYYYFYSWKDLQAMGEQ